MKEGKQSSKVVGGNQPQSNENLWLGKGVMIMSPGDDSRKANLK